MSRAPRLLAVGRMRPGPEAALFAEHNKRLRPPLLVTEIPEARGGTPEEVRRREGAAILAALNVRRVFSTGMWGDTRGTDPPEPEPEAEQEREQEQKKDEPELELGVREATP